MHVGEFGQPILLDAGIDLSSFPVLSVKFVRSNFSTLEVSSPDVVMGTVDVQTPIGVFQAHKYASYTFKEGDLNVAGSWTCQLSAIVPNVKQLSSDPITFQVDR